MRPTGCSRIFAYRPYLLPAAALVLSTACAVGPKYQRPAAPAPPAFTEAGAEWKQAQPSDAVARGKWWEIYNDPELNALEEQVEISNQNVLTAEARYREAKEAVRIARAGLFPNASGSVSVTNSRSSGGSSAVSPSGAVSSSSGTRTTYNLPLDVSYEADLWGGIRSSVRAGVATAQATFAQLENARLSFQALLAEDYFQLRGTDASQDLLQRTVKSYEDALQLTKDRLNAGVASGADVAQAQAQLDSAQAQLTELGVDRAQFVHAIAVLAGKPPEEISVSVSAAQASPPAVPVGVPSDLLERRPDIASAERQVAAANAQIGVERAAFFPTLTLSATGGFEASNIGTWLTWPSRYWSLGPQLAETIFDAGRRRAQVRQAQVSYDAAVATYRESVLDAFQQVEDNLAALRILEDVTKTQNDAVQAAQQALDISNFQYRAGTVSYLQVLSAQTAAFQAQSTAVSTMTRRMVASVLLVEALGGGWDSHQLPTPAELATK